MLRRVNAKGIGPRLVEAGPDKLAMEYIKGLPLGEFLEWAPRIELRPVLRDILRQCRLLDELGVNKQELTNPYKDILVAEEGPVLLDFERARLSDKPKNVTQFCQYLTSQKVSGLLDRAGISIDVGQVRARARAYKAAPTERRFKAIFPLLTGA